MDNQKNFNVPLNRHSHIKKVIGVVSGKGGVGKSSITALLASMKQREGYKVAVLDADITGASQAKLFGVDQTQIYSNGEEIFPAQTTYGMKVMSTHLLLESSDEPVLWRGPILADMVKQFWSDVCWGNIDYMFVDMPPGTGDVPLTVYQSIPLDGIVIVTSPQELVGMIVTKAINMARQMNIPILGIVENMSYVICPDCGKKIYLFGKSHLNQITEQYQVNALGQIPIDSTFTQMADMGMIEDFDAQWLEQMNWTL